MAYKEGVISDFSTRSRSSKLKQETGGQKKTRRGGLSTIT